VKSIDRPRRTGSDDLRGSLSGRRRGQVPSNAVASHARSNHRPSGSSQDLPALFSRWPARSGERSARPGEPGHGVGQGQPGSTAAIAAGAANRPSPHSDRELAVRYLAPSPGDLLRGRRRLARGPGSANAARPSPAIGARCPHKPLGRPQRPAAGVVNTPTLTTIANHEKKKKKNIFGSPPPPRVSPPATRHRLCGWCFSRVRSSRFCDHFGRIACCQDFFSGVAVTLVWRRAG